MFKVVIMQIDPMTKELSVNEYITERFNEGPQVFSVVHKDMDGKKIVSNFPLHSIYRYEVSEILE